MLEIDMRHSDDPQVTRISALGVPPPTWTHPVGEELYGDDFTEEQIEC
jgi:hypothetical protein